MIVRLGLLAGALVLILVAVVGSVTFPGATAAGPNAMAVDAISGDDGAPEPDPTRTVSAGDPVFDVSVHISMAGEPYAGYNAVLEYDSAVINFVPVGTTKVTYLNAAVHGMFLAAAANDVPASGTLRRTKMGAAGMGGTTSFVGEVVEVRYECVDNGSANLVLVPPAGAVDNTTTLGVGAFRIDTDLTSATVTCEGFAGPTDTPVPPTATETPTATATPVPPTATETPTATATPVPPTATDTPLPTATDTPVPPTATDTPLPPTATDTPRRARR